MTQEASVLDKLVPLEPLDLAKCFTVNDIVTGMSKCSFGARMLGEAADTLSGWSELSRKNGRSVVISDISCNNPLRDLLRTMVREFDFDGPYTTTNFLDSAGTAENVLVVGPYNEYDSEALYGKCGRMLFVNDRYQCRPGQVRDGHFPDVVFGNESIVLPILHLALMERLRDKRPRVADLLQLIQEGVTVTKDHIPYGMVAKEMIHGAHTLYKMLADEDSTNMFTVSGAMTVGKMQLLVADLIDTGRIKYVAATGALMAHGLIEGSGCKHYKYDPSVSDEVLASLGLNRVTDSLEPETNFDHIEEIVSAVLDGYGSFRMRCSHEFYHDIGRYIVEHYPDARSILASTYHRDVPIVTPAFIDSELGNDVFVHNRKRLMEPSRKLVFDSEMDTEVLFKLATTAKRLGIFTIGGGVPRNNTQNVAPLHEIYLNRLGIDGKPCIFHYGVRIDPAEMAPGGLSGCTYDEGVSWHKFTPGGPRAQIKSDATIVWPFMQRFALEKLGFYKAAA